MPCFECGAEAKHDHHVVPRVLGGTKTLPLCERCHSLVHGRNMVGASRLTRAALAAKKARGEKTGGDLPYGYRLASDGVHLEIDRTEARAVRTAKRLHRGGLSLRKIGDTLLGLGFAPRGGRVWNPKTVLSIVRSNERRI